jgi:hypothetical protein
MPAGRRPARILLNAATAASLLIWTAIAVLWLRGFTDLGDSPDGLSNAFAHRGSIYVKHRTRPDVSMADATSYDRWRFLGFGAHVGTRADGESETWRVFHVWPLAVICSIAPSTWVVRRRAARRRAARAVRNHCPACGYDLRATSDRCPECGSERADTSSAGASDARG